jgi:hypothetical protein
VPKAKVTQCQVSGTRLTNEFRYVLDMIILVVSAGGGAARSGWRTSRVPWIGRAGSDAPARSARRRPLAPSRRRSRLARCGAARRVRPDTWCRRRQLSGAVDDPGHRHPRGRLACGPAALHRLSWLGVGFAALDMFGDQLCPLCQLRTGGSDMLLPPGIHSWQQTQWYEDASAGRPMPKFFGIPYCPDAHDPVT